MLHKLEIPEAVKQTGDRKYNCRVHTTFILPRGKFVFIQTSRWEPFLNVIKPGLIRSQSPKLCKRFLA